MPSTYETKHHDLHYLFEAGYDEVPVIRAYAMFKDEEGDYNTETATILDRYDFTEEDVDWLLRNTTQYAGAPYEDLGEFYVDEWFTSTNTDMHPFLPPNALIWIDCLGSYLMTDLSADEREVN